MSSTNLTNSLFLAASSALVLTGYLIHPIFNQLQVILLLICGWSGTYVMYKAGHVFYQHKSIAGFFEQFKGKYGLSIFMFQFLIVLPILCWFFLPKVCFWIFFAIFNLAWLYSFPIEIGSRKIILKKVLLVKNIFIGFSWGALILIGAGEIDLDSRSWWMFVFISFHIVIGSILRDHFDVEQDKNNHVQTLPLVMGISKSTILLSIVNILLFLVFLNFTNGYVELVVLIAITLYKAILLLIAVRKPNSVFWTQTMNIGFNFFVFFLVLILTCYGIS